MSIGIHFVRKFRAINSVFGQLSRGFQPFGGKLANGSPLLLAFQRTMSHNRLGEERSPYLLQHAENPVHWYPWGQEAFQAARESNKLIFLSVGYSTCHWCHVMERESFESEEVAEIMNEHFINVKVDREERPDVDKVYMSFVQASTGGGGWPMSVFLTPTLKPIFGGTYFPPDDQMFGRPGFKSVLKALANKWEAQHDQLVDSGDKIIEAMASSMESKAKASEGELPSSEAVMKKCFNQLVKSYDPEMGGFSRAPKFPQPVNFNFLFRMYARQPNEDRSKQALKMCLHTLDMMAKGGIHDHVSKGFARYSTDKNWHVPHFEKMLYDQAQLVVAYAYAYQATKEGKFSAIVEDILAYVGRDLQHPLGAFYSAEDADSLPQNEAGHKKREGAFCVWTHQELKELLKDDLLQLAEAYFNVKPNGNVDPRTDPHGELKGQNVLTTVPTDEGKIMQQLGLDRAKMEEKLAQIKDILYNKRIQRPRPHLDDKIITAWNGLMISGFSVAGTALQNQAYIGKAVTAAQFLRQHMYDPESKTLYRSAYSSKDNRGDVEQLAEPIHGFVDDYAFLIRGLLDLYEATFDPSWVEWAADLQDKQNALFWDATGHGYYTAPEGDASIVLRMKEEQDGAEPSANSVSVLNLQRLAVLLDRSEYKAKAGQVLAVYSETLDKFPVALPEMTTGLMLMQNTPVQIIVTGDLKDSSTANLVAAVQTALIPHKVLVLADGNKESILYKNMAILKDLPQGKAFVCQNYACSEPVENPEALLKKILNE